MLVLSVSFQEVQYRVLKTSRIKTPDHRKLIIPLLQWGREKVEKFRAKVKATAPDL